MKPIISPWLIYFAELADSINMAFLFVTFIAFIIMAFAFIPYMDNKKDETLKQCLKKSFIWFCISVQLHYLKEIDNRKSKFHRRNKSCRFNRIEFSK